MDNFEKAHDKWLEPDEPKVVALDWNGEEIYEGDGFYWVDPEGEYIRTDQVDEYMATICTSAEF